MGWFMSTTFENYVEEAKKAIEYPKSGIIAAIRSGLGSPPVSKGIASAFFNLTQVMYLKQLDELAPDTIDKNSTLGRLLRALPTKDEERNKKSELFEPNEKNRLYQGKNGALNLVNVFQNILADTKNKDPTDKLTIILDILHEVFANIAPYNDKAALKPFKTAIHRFAREIQGVANDNNGTSGHFECRLFDTQKLTNKLTQQVDELNLLSSIANKLTELDISSLDLHPSEAAANDFRQLQYNRMDDFQKKLKNLLESLEKEINGADTIGYSITGPTFLVQLRTLQTQLKELTEIDILQPTHNETPKEHQPINKAKEKVNNIKNSLSFVANKLTQTERQLTVLKKYLSDRHNHNITKDDEDPSQDHQAYHFIPRNVKTTLGYGAELDSNDLDPLTDNEDYNKKKKAKNKLRWGAFVNSLLVAIGQGMIPFVFAISVVGLPMAITIGIAGTLCNFFLFRGDAYGVLKDLRFGTFFLDKDGQPLSDTKKHWVKVGIVFAILSALTTGLLTFMSTKAGIIKLCLMLGFASGPVAPIVIGAIIAVLTTFALGFVFTQIVTKWVREDTLQKFRRQLTWHNIKNYFEPPEYLKTKKQRYEYVAKQILNIILTPIAVAFAIAVSAVVVGIFSKQSAAVFSSIDKSIRISNALSILLIGTVGSVVNLLNIIFYTRAIWFLKNATAGILLAVGNFIIHPIDTIKAGKAWLAGKTKPAESIEMATISNSESSTDAATTVPDTPRQNSTRTIGDRLRMIARVSSLTKLVTLLTAIVLNAMGQGDGATASASVISPFAYARSLRFIDSNSLVGGSAGCNARPGLAVCQTDTESFERKWSKVDEQTSIAAITSTNSPWLLAQTSHGVLIDEVKTDDAAPLLGAGQS